MEILLTDKCAMNKPSEFYEIEIKSLLNKNKYDELLSFFRSEYLEINDEIIHTTRYLPNDLRLRYSDKTFEVVYKDGTPTSICRKEIIVPLQDMNHLIYLEKIFLLEQYSKDRSWIKHKIEFEYPYGDYMYCLCLQHIYDFGYILEVEYINSVNDSNIHENNIREVMRKLNCKEIDSTSFTDKIHKFRVQQA